MSGILQQGYSMGYVFAACANLGVGGAVETWKTVFGKEESATAKEDMLTLLSVRIDSGHFAYVVEISRRHHVSH